MRLIVNIPIKICCFRSMLKLPLNKEKVHPAENNASIIMDSWKPGTRKRYQSTWNKWLTFCTTQAGCGSSAICAARSALSSLVTIENCNDIASHVLVKRFMKGIFYRHLPEAKYSST